MPYKFTFDDEDNDENVHFECMLQCSRCTGTCADGTQCKRTVCIGLPLCWQHLKRDKHVRIQESLIPGAGKGAFAADTTRGPNEIVFKPGDKIVDYTGEVLTKDEIDARFGKFTAPYAFEVLKKRGNNPGKIIDAACSRGVGSNVNHATGNRTNARFSIWYRDGQSHSSLKATKNIRNGDEILVNYGREYKMHEGRFSTKPVSRPRAQARPRARPRARARARARRR